ncbi:Hypothetical protein NGAL_HAMBI2605_59420 [Neorhizobium galegae bv. orientalis]|nr:Hypothetical protein NGAL_HAMBI2605_59420 [Neorhizobium galegae bv. orientalis]
MSTPVADNPAATDPHKNLTTAQRQALLAIDFYRHQRAAGPEVIIGTKRFKASTIAELQRKELIRQGRGIYSPTLAGTLAVGKLKGGR